MGPAPQSGAMFPVPWGIVHTSHVEETCLGRSIYPIIHPYLYRLLDRAISESAAVHHIHNNCVIIIFFTALETWKYTVDGSSVYETDLCHLHVATQMGDTRPHFYQTRSAWSVDQGSNENHSPAYNFAPTVTKFCVMWEGLWTAERFLVDPWSMDYADPVW